jgi:23S rRNA C2498 (ribose-2'-O)-methylase RlmM
MSENEKGIDAEGYPVYLIKGTNDDGRDFYVAVLAHWKFVNPVDPFDVEGKVNFAAVETIFSNVNKIRLTVEMVAIDVGDLPGGLTPRFVPSEATHGPAVRITKR